MVLVRRVERRGQAGLRVYWGASPERGAWLAGTELGRYEELLDLDFTAPEPLLDHPLALVCTHGKRDRCCARFGRPLYEALRELAEPDWVWQATHLGGDRFAGNVVFLPEGLYFGRVGRAEAWAVLEEYLAGRVHLGCYRGRSCYPFAVQAAERALREHTDLTAIGDLELVSTDPICFRAEGRAYEVEVVRERSEAAYLTCGAERLSHPRRFAAGTPRARGA